jgi:hypothetical protein
MSNTDFPDVKLKANVVFPAQVVGQAGIDITSQNDIYYFNLGYDDFLPPTTLPTNLTTTCMLVWDSVAHVFSLVPVPPVYAGSSTVAQLPAAGQAGRRAFVSDATAVTFQSIVAGGGANKVPVFDDGTNWRIG